MIIENIIFDRRLIESNCFDNISRELNANVKLKFNSNLDENSAGFRRNINKIFSLARRNYKTCSYNLYTIKKSFVFARNNTRFVFKISLIIHQMRFIISFAFKSSLIVFFFL